MHPLLFEIPFLHLKIHSYGVMVALGMLVGIWVSVLRAKRAGVAPDIFYDIGLWSMVAGILGARAAYVAQNLEQYSGEQFWYLFQASWLTWLKIPRALAIWEGGQVLYGGLILAVLVDLWMLHRRNLPVLKIADLAAPGVLLGIGIGRLGCFLNGCCWGKVAEGLPWAVCFPAGSAVQRGQIDRGLAGAHWGGDAMPVHPSQIYATIFGIILYIVLSVWYERRRWDGQIFSLAIIGYGVARFAEEHFRGDTISQPRFWGAMDLNPGQYVSVFILAAGVLCYLIWGARDRKLESP